MDNLLYIDEITIEKCIIILNERFKNKKIYTALGAVLLSIHMSILLEKMIYIV